MAKPSPTDCYSVVCLIFVLEIIVISSYVSFYIEHSYRTTYCMVTGNAELEFELDWRQPLKLQLAGEIVFSAMLVWNLICLIYDVQFWMFSFV